jgi:FKBP-type peptidyl-prolyl cis-trans isomerase FkpA
MRRLTLALLLLLPLAAAGCESATEPRIEDTRFAGHLGIDLAAMTRTPGGVYYRDLTVGTGAVAQSGHRLAVHYKGWLSTGLMFEQLQPPAAPFVFVVGQRRVITGWEQGIPGMREGGTRQLVIPPGLAYGREGQGSIPGNAILVFEVSLVSVALPGS